MIPHRRRNTEDTETKAYFFYQSVTGFSHLKVLLDHSKNIKQEKPAMKILFRALVVAATINMRNRHFGGRTKNFKYPYVKCEEF